MKRIFDIFFSLLGLTALSPLFILTAIFVKLDSKGPVFFKQLRMGKDFKEFKIIKFRSMAHTLTSEGPQVTVGGDMRITSVGKFIRKYKIDELPQLINVLKGDMSFVGPRPEVKKYVDCYKSDYKKILSVRPGITDPASIEYSDEETILSSSSNWEEDYIQKVLPEKIRLSLTYIDTRHTIMDDVSLILKTLLKI